MGRIAKILGLIAIVALLLGGGALFPVVAQAATVVTIEAPAEATADSDFTANISVNELTDFDACQYDVTFDPLVLRLDDVTSGLIGSTAVPVDIFNEFSAGTYRVIQNVPGLTGVTGSGYLAVLHFHVIGSEGESSAIDLSNGVLSDITATQIPATWVGDTVDVSDFTAPTVDSTSPTSGATDVLLDTVVTATFSEAMDETTITTGSFTIAGVSGSVSYNSGSYTATFTPAADLAYNTTYTASLSTAITDAAGNPLASTYSWSFTTGSLPGVATVSIDAPTGVDLDSDFTADVDISSVTDFDACQYDVTFDPLVLRLDDVTVGLIGSTPVPVDIFNELSAGTYRVIQNVPGLTGATGSGYLAVLHFHAIGSEGESSAIDLSNGILSDITATQIEAVWTGDTVTVADTVAPTVVITSPADDATDVLVDTTVTATFSEAMDESTITTGSFTIAGMIGSVSYNAGTDTATFTPAIGLAYETTYTASLSTAITDAAGNPLASTYSWSFTTQPVPPGTVLVSIDAPAGPRTGSSFTANVNISDVTDFDACQYDVTFDPLVLRLDDVTAGEIGSTEIPVDIFNELSAGTFRVVQNVPGLTGATGSGYLAVLNFYALGSEDDVSTIALSNGTLSNILAEEITAVWVGDSVTIARRPSGGGGGGGGGGGAPPDTTAPAISGVGVSNVTKTSADVAWNTDEESDSQVWYRASPAVVTPLDTELVTEHIIHLDELTSGSNYYFKVMSTDDAGNLAESDEHTFTTLPEEAAFTTGQLSVSPSAVYVGEVVTISVLVANNGDVTGSYAVTLKIDGVAEETKEITLDAGASEEVTFTTTKNTAGTYSVEVGGLSGSFMVKEQPEETTPPPEIPEEPTINWPIIWGAMAGVLVVGVVILWIAIRRRAY